MDFVGFTVWFVWAVFLAGSVIATAYYAERFLQYLKNLQELGLEQLQHSKQELEYLSSIQRLLGEIWSQQRGRGGPRLPLLGQGYRPRLNGRSRGL